MSGHGEAAHEAGHGGTTKLFLIVWVSVLGITLAEVYLAYLHFDPVAMLLMLIGLSVLKAGLIVAYFMHLRFERFGLFLTLVPATIFCIGMMTVIFPDSMRLMHVRKDHKLNSRIVTPAANPVMGTAVKPSPAAGLRP